MPDWISAHIGVEPLLRMRESEALLHRRLLAIAAERNDTTALTELQSVAPYPGDGVLDMDTLGLVRKWVRLYGGLAAYRDNADFYLRAARLSPDYPRAERAAIDAGGALSVRTLIGTLSDARGQRQRPGLWQGPRRIRAQQQTPSPRVAQLRTTGPTARRPDRPPQWRARATRCPGRFAAIALRAYDRRNGARCRRAVPDVSCRRGSVQSKCPWWPGDERNRSLRVLRAPGVTDTASTWSAMDAQWSRLPRAFYRRHPTLVAPELLNRILVRADGRAARIVEVEAYAGSEDPAAHTFRGPTPRTATMFGEAGHLYVYFTYGMHWGSNAVCGEIGEGFGVLLRAVEPLRGLALMRDARPRAKRDRDLASGPGKLSQAFGITGDLDGTDLVHGATLAIMCDGTPPPSNAVAGPRIGITRAVEFPWRWHVPGHPHVSLRVPKSPVRRSKK